MWIAMKIITKTLYIILIIVMHTVYTHNYSTMHYYIFIFIKTFYDWSIYRDYYKIMFQKRTFWILYYGWILPTLLKMISKKKLISQYFIYSQQCKNTFGH